MMKFQVKQTALYFTENSQKTTSLLKTSAEREG